MSAVICCSCSFLGAFKAQVLEGLFFFFFSHFYSHYSGLRCKRRSRRLVKEKTFLFISTMSYSRMTFLILFFLRFNIKLLRNCELKLTFKPPLLHTMLFEHVIQLDNAQTLVSQEVGKEKKWQGSQNPWKFSSFSWGAPLYIQLYGPIHVTNM